MTINVGSLVVVVVVVVTVGIILLEGVVGMYVGSYDDDVGTGAIVGDGTTTSRLGQNSNRAGSNFS